MQAGAFYPADPVELAAEAKRLLAGVRRVSEAPAKMVLVPHAGWRFSAAVAAASIGQLAPGFTRAVILAGNHNGQARYAGVSVERSTHWALPGFEVPVAAAAADLLARPGFADVPAAHGMHMIEVELPLLREVAGGPFAIVPLVGDRVGREDAPALAAELARLDDPKTVFVISVDLSHYYPYDRAVALDRPCLAALAAADEDAVATCDTDATQVLVVMTELAARLGLTPRLITYQNSGDVTGDRSGVVGYGAIAYEERFRLGSGESEALVRLARTSLETQVRQGRTPTVPADLVRRWPRLTTPRGAFVTLKEKGALRGCIGSLMPVKALAADVVDNAVAAAVADTRFAPVQADELPAIAVSVSVLDLPRPLGAATGDAVAELLARTKPGVILSFQGRRSTFLPEVWDELPAPREFLAHLCAKQGSPADCWLQPDAAFQTYATQHIE